MSIFTAVKRRIAVTPAMRRRSARIHRGIKEAVVLAPKSLVGGLCPLPNFVIIGTMKGGTSSLYHYMCLHPRITPAMFKELRFFSANYHKGINWYRAHFPLRLNKGQDAPRLTGEASPNYLFHPHAARRAHQWIPEVKLIAMLRDPVDRAYSQHYHKIKKGTEHLSFEQALERELQQEETARSELKRILEDETYYSADYYRYTDLLGRGRYVEQLENWTTHFPRQQMLILKSEDFYADPSSTLSRVYEFLDLPNWKHNNYQNRNPGINRAKMSTPTREFLKGYFRPHNKKLYEFLGANMGWDD